MEAGFFEQGFGGAYENERNNSQFGIKSDFYKSIADWYDVKVSGEFRLTDLNYIGSMTPTIIDTYKNIRGNFYSGKQYTLDATKDANSPYFGWPDPNAIIKPLSEKYQGNFFYFVGLLSNNFKINNNITLNLGFKNSTSNIGKNFSIIDPFTVLKIKFLKIFELNTGYANNTQITSIYQSYSNPYDPYSYGFDASFDAEGNPNINPERANNFEIGLACETSKISAGLVYYYRNTYNDILTARSPEIVPKNIDPNVSERYFQYQNLGEGFANGWEIRFLARLQHNLRVSVLGNLFSKSLSRVNSNSPYENTRNSQINTLNVIINYNNSKVETQFHIEYGSGLPYRWREIVKDNNGNTTTIRHNFDKYVDPHIVFNGSIAYKIIPNLMLELNFMNIQGLLSPIFKWDKNQFIEYRDTDSAQNLLGIPRFAFYSIPRVNFGIRYKI
ncbi:MAG: TonB-dependent receptor [Saprospiraceae bacterium]|nr:TonB-dependent receptor [Saprospiraceae bacterium]